jgi:5'-3' exonuclease
MAQKRLLLIDGHSMAYRAFFALPAENFTTAQGQHTNAIYGFATMLFRAKPFEPRYFLTIKPIAPRPLMNFAHRCHT